MIDGTITYDCSWTNAHHEAEQDCRQSVLLDRVDDGFPFLVSLPVIIALDYRVS